MPQMPSEMTITERLAYSTVRLELRMADGSTGTGTGFVYTFEMEGARAPVIVTNRHVFEGAVNVRFHLTVVESGNLCGRHDSFDLNNIQNDWIPHPDPAIDLAIFPLGPLLLSLASTGASTDSWPGFAHINKPLVATDAYLNELSPGDGILMIGYVPPWVSWTLRSR
jgi:hypothetical protein